MTFPATRRKPAAVSTPSTTGSSEPSPAAGAGGGTGAIRPAGQWRRTVSKSAVGSIGLATWSFMPDARQRWRSSTVAWAVMAMIGRSTKRGSARISAVAWNPSISGICTSIRTTSKRPSPPRRTASAATRPFPATSICAPTPCRSSTATCWLISLSSASRILAPSSLTPSSAAPPAPRQVAASAGANSVARVSTSTVLVTGLTRKASMRVCSAPSRTSSLPKAVTMMIAGCRPTSGSPLMRRAASTPSTSGIFQSMNTAS